MLMGANFIIKILGLLRETLLAQFYGASMITDAYIIANNIPSVLFAAIGTCIATTFIPQYTRIKMECGEERANTFAVHMLECGIVICSAMTILGERFIKEIVFIFAAGFEGPVLQLAITFSRILFPSIFGLALINIMGAYLQQHNNFLPIAIVPIVNNGLIIISLFVSNITENIYILIYGTLIASLLQIIFYIPWILKTGILKRKKIKLIKDEYLSLLFITVIPVFIGEAVNELNSIIDRTLVSGLDTGSVSILNYAYKIINLIIGVFVASIGSVTFPKIANIAIQKKYKGFQQYGSDLSIVTIMIIVPITISLIIFRREIIELLFQRGEFDVRSTILTGNVMGFYAIGLVSIGTRDILTKLFFSIQNTKTPMYNGIICALVNIVLDVMLINKIGLYGAALATGIASILSTILLILSAKRYHLINIKYMTSPILKILISAIFIVIFDLIGKNIIDRFIEKKIFSFLSCVIIGIIGILIYITINGILKNFSSIKNI